MTPLSTNADKATTAAWMGYPPGLAGIVAMDRLHDSIHRELAATFGLPSLSMRVAEGQRLDGPDQILAGIEEDAALMVQRWVQHMRRAGYLAKGEG